MQPCYEVNVIADTAADLLRSVDMGIHKAGQYIFTMQVDNLCIGLYELRIHFTHSLDTVVFYQHTAVVVDQVNIVHCNDITVFQ